MCKSKFDGGMGFRNLQAFNLAMLTKQAWRILKNPNSLIARIYKAKYFPFSDILSAKLGYNPSYAWRSIFNSLEVIRRGIRWRVGNGKLIHIWEDKWLPNPTTYKVCSPPQDIGDFPMVSSLIDEETRHWKVEMVKRFFLPFEAESIINIPLRYNLPNDSIIWVETSVEYFLLEVHIILRCLLWIVRRRERAQVGILGLDYGRRFGNLSFLPKSEFLRGGLVLMGCPLD